MLNRLCALILGVICLVLAGWLLVELVTRWVPWRIEAMRVWFLQLGALVMLCIAWGMVRR